ncbi:MAG: exosortase-dependent surface protein XDP1 [Glaciecola sp.]
MFKKFLLVSAMTVASLNAFASGQTWNFNTASTSNSDAGNTLSYNQDGISLTVSAWASTGNGCATYHSPHSSDTDTNSCIEEAELEQIYGNNSYYGIGIQNNNESSSNTWPNHGIDNASSIHGEQDYEMVLLSFSQAVNLTTYSMGLTYSDSDSSVAAFTGSSSQFNGSFASHTTWSDLVGNGTNGGWDLIDDNTQIVGKNQSATLNVSNSNDVYSKYWLVGAINSALGGGWNYDNNDSFKFSGITTISHSSGTGTPPVTNASAPAILALFTLSGLVLLRRRT